MGEALAKILKTTMLLVAVGVDIVRLQGAEMPWVLRRINKRGNGIHSNGRSEDLCRLESR
jgi:hypothetical protein